MNHGLGKRILLADDEPTLLDVMEMQLLATITPKPQILRMTDGEEALKAALVKEPDLIITDINMPKVDGIKFLTELRRFGILTPVIVVTGFGNHKVRRRAWDLGVFDFLEKPFEAQALTETVRVALSIGFMYNKSRREEGKTDDQTVPVPVRLSPDELTALRKRCEETGESVSDLIHAFLKKAM